MIVFRFREEPDEPVVEMLQHFGFHVEGKEAWRVNDPSGRAAANRAAWYLQDMLGEGVGRG